MENSGTKLEIRLDIKFLLNFLSFYNDNEDSHFKNSFKNNFFDFSISSIKSINGNEYDKTEFEYILANLSQIIDKPSLNQEETDVQCYPIEFILNNHQFKPTTFFFIEKDPNFNKSQSEKTGYVFWNHKQIIEGFKTICFNDEMRYGTIKKININDRVNLFEWEHISTFKLPVNTFSLNDQFMTSWEKSEFEANIIGLLTNVVINESQICKPHIRIISRIKVNSVKKNKDEPKSIECLIKDRILEQELILKKYLDNKATFELLIINEYLLDFRFCERNKIESNLKFDRIEIKKILHILHDRFFYTNYVYGEAGNSFNFIKTDGSRTDTSLTLGSLININFMESMSHKNIAFEECFNIYRDPIFLDFFTHFSNLK